MMHPVGVTTNCKKIDIIVRRSLNFFRILREMYASMSTIGVPNLKEIAT